MMLQWSKDKYIVSDTAVGCKNGHKFSPFLYLCPCAMWLCSSFHQKAESILLLLEIWAWPCDLLWSMKHQQMWRKARLEKFLHTGPCTFLLLLGTLKPPHVNKPRLVCWHVPKLSLSSEMTSSQLPDMSLRPNETIQLWPCWPRQEQPPRWFTELWETITFV